MPYDYPKPLTGRVDEDIRSLWEDLFHLIEKLRLEEEQKETERKETLK